MSDLVASHQRAPDRLLIRSPELVALASTWRAQAQDVSSASRLLVREFGADLPDDVRVDVQQLCTRWADTLGALASAIEHTADVLSSTGRDFGEVDADVSRAIYAAVGAR